MQYSSPKCHKITRFKHISHNLHSKSKRIWQLFCSESLELKHVKIWSDLDMCWEEISLILISIILYLIHFLKYMRFQLCFVENLLGTKRNTSAQVSKWIVYKWYSAVWVIACNSLPFESISCVKSTLLIRPVFMFREPAEPASFSSSASLALFLSLAFVLNYWGTAVCPSEA